MRLRHKVNSYGCMTEESFYLNDNYEPLLYIFPNFVPSDLLQCRIRYYKQVNLIIYVIQLKMKTKIALSTCLCAPLLMTSCGTKETQQPNVIVLLCDDAGYADFGFNGSPDLKTPHIDALAKAGTICTDAHVSATVSGPSRAGLMTGRYQQRFGFECNPSAGFTGIDLNETTIGDAMQLAGYHTSAFGKWHLGDDEAYKPNSRGFDYSYGFLSGGRGYFPNEKNDREGASHSMRENDKFVTFEGYLTDNLASKAVDYIKRHTDEPFFMYWAPNAVHTPMQATEEDMALFEGHDRQTLAAMTYALDRGVGEIVQALKDEKLYENTIIFFLSDNGGSPENTSSCYPLRGFKGNKFEGGHRVPFFVTWPKHIKANTTYNGLISALDIFSTSLAAATQTISDTEKQNKISNIFSNLDGVDLMPYLTGKKEGEPHASLFWRKGEGAAARVGDMKLIRVDRLGERLYDVEKDIAEEKDLSQDDAASLASLCKELKNWEKDMMVPLWVEGHTWDTITWMIHEDLYNNREVRVKSPWQLRRLKKKLKNQNKK